MKIENPNASVTLTLNEWSHALSGLAAALSVVQRDNSGNPVIARFVATFGDPINTLEAVHDKICDQVGAETGSPVCFGDRIDALGGLDRLLTNSLN
jgi:hypothetical protein